VSEFDRQGLGPEVNEEKNRREMMRVVEGFEKGYFRKMREVIGRTRVENARKDAPLVGATVELWARVLRCLHEVINAARPGMARATTLRGARLTRGEAQRRHADKMLS